MATDSGVKENFGRRPLRLGRVLTRGPLYFVTFCTHQRRPFLARDEVHAAFVLFAERAERDFNIGVGGYVIMPDHVHLIVRGGEDFRLGCWVRSPETSAGKGIKFIPSKNTALAGRIFRSCLAERRELLTKMELRP